MSEYHKQPHTQDPNVEIPEDAPLAQGHDQEEAEEVKAEADALSEAVEEEAGSPEVTARAPGDHAGSDEDERI